MTTIQIDLFMWAKTQIKRVVCLDCNKREVKRKHYRTCDSCLRTQKRRFYCA